DALVREGMTQRDRRQAPEGVPVTQQHERGLEAGRRLGKEAWEPGLRDEDAKIGPAFDETFERGGVLRSQVEVAFEFDGKAGGRGGSARALEPGVAAAGDEELAHARLHARRRTR